MGKEAAEKEEEMIRRTEAQWRKATDGLWDWESRKALVRDAYAAKMLECPISTIAAARIRYGIVSVLQQRLGARPKIEPVTIDEVASGVWDIAEGIARLSDSCVATMLDCSVSEVHAARQARGIKPPIGS